MKPPGGPPDLQKGLRLLPDLRKVLPTPPGPLEGPPDSSRTSWRASRPLLDLWEVYPDSCWTSGSVSRLLLDLWECLSTPPGPPGRPPNHSWTSQRTFRPLLDLQKGLSDLQECLPTPPGSLGGLTTPPGPPEGPPDPSRSGGPGPRTRAGRGRENFRNARWSETGWEALL